ncbi:MAG: zf-TFIIB domain-containing protein [Dethiobacter sp.]|nr:zf-TFIIB domain-containing protein [Dethiobacter sp.]MCL5981363.1 zf-TFIIB domain-containing protein [Bacillota bacterium]
MMCPVCSNVELKMAERQRVEIDYCPKCRGVWLDRGELDKIIEFSVPQGPTERSRRPEEFGVDQDNLERGKRKRRSALGDLFDF